MPRGSYPNFFRFIYLYTGYQSSFQPSSVSDRDTIYPAKILIAFLTHSRLFASHLLFHLSNAFLYVPDDLPYCSPAHVAFHYVKSPSNCLCQRNTAKCRDSLSGKDCLCLYLEVTGIKQWKYLVDKPRNGWL